LRGRYGASALHRQRIITERLGPASAGKTRVGGTAAPSGRGARRATSGRSASLPARSAVRVSSPGRDGPHAVRQRAVGKARVRERARRVTDSLVASSARPTLISRMALVGALVVGGWSALVSLLSHTWRANSGSRGRPMQSRLIRGLGVLILVVCGLAWTTPSVHAEALPQVESEHMTDITQWVYRNGDVNSSVGCSQACQALWEREHGVLPPQVNRDEFFLRVG
jgi:hypothetical protein